MTTTSPYADSYDTYWRNGWRGILPLPARRKKHPPTGYTGHDGTEPSYADCATWADSNTDGNVCLRLPPTVIGIDVDAYDGRVGAQTLADLVGKYGPLPPTVMSSSRGDGISGIRLYQVPTGTRLITKLPGIEFVQRHHRYAVVWPSIHPDTEATYQWIDEQTGDPTTPPNIHQLPHLPTEWLDGLASTNTEHTPKADIDVDTTRRILAELPTGDPCHHIAAAAGKAMAEGDRHDIYNEAVLAVIGRGRDGCPGALTTIGRLRAAFLSEVTADGTSHRRTRDEANNEWTRSLRGAVALIANRSQGNGCPDDAITWLQDAGVIPEQTPPTHDKKDDTDSGPSDSERAYQAAVDRKTAELKVLADARQQLASIEAAAAPTIDPIGLDQFLQQPDLPTHYRVDQLWPAEGRVLLVAAAKTGKTTMVGRNLIPALLDGGFFLGRFETPATTRNILYLNMEVSENTLRAWMRTTRITNSQQLVVANLRGKSSALQLATPQGRRRLSGFLTDHDIGTVILDPLAPVLAAHGLVEDSNSDVARFFAWWSEALTDGGVDDDLICHHAGHAGERSRGASRLLDEPDAIWTITRTKTQQVDDDIIPVDQHRFLTAYGRDVDLPESALKFHGDTGLLELLSDNPNQIRRNHNDQVIEQRVLVALRDIEESGDTASGKKVEDRATGKGVHIRAALNRLARRGVIYEEDLGPGRGTLYRLIHHPSSSPSSRLVPTGDEPPSSPPFMGDGGGGGLDNPTTTGRGTNPK